MACRKISSMDLNSLDSGIGEESGGKVSAVVEYVILPRYLFMANTRQAP